MIDKTKIEQAIVLLLEGMGEDKNREGLRETPSRIARMYEELFAGVNQTPEPYLTKTFTVEDSGMVLEKDIVFYLRTSFVTFLWKSSYCLPSKWKGGRIE